MSMLLAAAESAPGNSWRPGGRHASPRAVVRCAANPGVDAWKARTGIAAAELELRSSSVIHEFIRTGMKKSNKRYNKRLVFILDWKPIAIK